jgi:DNA-binding transcriptional regulator YiaG
MNIVEIYRKLKTAGDWVTPKMLRHTRKCIYRMTQEEFSELLGISSWTYISWERGRYRPSSPSQALLHVATYHKDVFLKNREQFLEKIGEFEDQGF